MTMHLPSRRPHPHSCPAQTAEVENHMTSVERLLAYTQLDSEPLRVAEGGGQPPQGWPRSGHLQFEDVSAAYQPGAMRTRARGRMQAACTHAVC